MRVPFLFFKGEEKRNVHVFSSLFLKIKKGKAIFGRIFLRFCRNEKDVIVGFERRKGGIE